MFSNVPKHDHLGLWVTHGLNAQRVAEFLELDKREVAHISKVSPASVRWDCKIPREVLDHLTQIAVICDLVAQFFEGDIARTQLWLKTENPLLGNISPRDMVRYGRHEKLRCIVMEALTDNGIAAPEMIQVEIKDATGQAAPQKARAC